MDAGKVRYLGISEAAPETIRKAHATHILRDYSHFAYRYTLKINV